MPQLTSHPDFLRRAWLDPYDDDDARAHSQYYGVHDGELVRLLETAPPTVFAQVAHGALRVLFTAARIGSASTNGSTIPP